MRSLRRGPITDGEVHGYSSRGTVLAMEITQQGDELRGHLTIQKGLPNDVAAMALLQALAALGDAASRFTSDQDPA